jgi:TgpA N-terminal domain/Transglutaminase-like superfamily/Domain of unknown function (DUF4129)
MASPDRTAGTRGTDLAQALALAGLLTGASLSLGRLYDGNHWWLPTWLTMMSALGLAALLRRAGAGQAVSLAAMLAGFFVVAGVLLFPDTLFVVVPTPATWRAMTAAARVAMQGMVDQAAPVAVTKEFVLLTCAGAWAVATAADGLTFRARQPLLALVPTLGLFVFPAIVRNSSPAWYTLWFLLGAAGVLLTEGRARLATWGMWVSNPRSRPASGWRLPTTPAANTGRWLAAGAAVVALALPWLLPGYGRAPLLDYRSNVESQGPVSINPFVSLRTRLRASAEQTLFTVQAVSGSYWRLQVLDQFDGTTWRQSARPDDVAPFVPGISPVDQSPKARSQDITQRVVIDELSGSGGNAALPAAATPIQVRANQPILRGTSSRALVAKRRFHKGFSYTVVSRELHPEPADLEGVQSYRDTPAEAYTRIDNVSDRVRNQAVTLTEGQPSAYRKALALQDYLRGPLFKYDLNVPELQSGSGDQLTKFLFEVKRGYCEQFASAMAAMARSVGLPARVAVGFTPGHQVGDKWEVTTHDAHAWPEIWFQDVGWVPFEPTPRTDQVELPAYTVNRNVTSAPTTTLGGGATGTTANPSGSTSPSQRAQLDNANRDAQLGRRKASPGLLQRRVVQVPLAVLLLVLLVPAVKGGRNLVARRRAARQPRDAVAEAYAEVTAWAGDAGIGRRPAETPNAYASRVAAAYGPEAEPLVELTALYVTAEYAAGGAGADQAHQARRLARAARARLAARLGWGRRLLAALSPRSLFAPRPILPRPPAPAGRAGRELTLRR